MEIYLPFSEQRWSELEKWSTPRLLRFYKAYRKCKYWNNDPDFETTERQREEQLQIEIFLYRLARLLSTREHVSLDKSAKSNKNANNGIHRRTKGQSSPRKMR